MYNYFDIRSEEVKAFSNVVNQVFGHACKRLGITLNEGHEKDLEERVVIDPTSLQSFDEQNKNNNLLHENRLKFEDDVISYLMLRVLSFDKPEYQQQLKNHVRVIETDVFETAERSQNDTGKIAVYRDNGDFLLLSMSIGTIGTTDNQKRRSQNYYGVASVLSHRRFGRDSKQYLLFEKLSSRFDRYFAITSEVFQEAFYLAKLKSDAVGISEEDTIDKLLDKLNQTSDKLERAKISTELKRLTTPS